MAGLTPKPKRPPIDWDGVELHYRAGIRSLMDIAKEYGVTDAGILKRAKTKGWTRDLAGKIKARATAKVNEAVVSGAVSAQRKVKESAIIEANSDQMARVDLLNRQDTNLALDISRVQMRELAALSACDMAEELKWLANTVMQAKMEQGIKPNVVMKLVALFEYIVSLPGRVRLSKEIAAAHSVYIPMQRKILKLDDDAHKSQSEIDVILARINAAAN